MLPLPPPYPVRLLLALAMVSVGGCFQSTLPGGFVAPEEPAVTPPRPQIPDLPQLSAVRSFELFGVDGRCVADSWRVDIDERGNVRSSIDALGNNDALGNTDASGVARGNESQVVVSLGTQTLELLRADDEWSGFELWHVYEGSELIAWAVELPALAQTPPDLPSFRACASFEQWSLHEIEGGASHEEAVVDIERARWLGDARDFPLWLDVEADGQVLFHDARLPLRDDGAPSGEVRAEVVTWDGTEGVVRVRNSVGLCAAADGELIFRLVRDEIHVMQAWYVVDAEDRDHDGDRVERHLRRTRSVLTRRACPSAVRR